jgi:hypothetical protein
MIAQVNEIASRITRHAVNGDAVLNLPATPAWLSTIDADKAYTAQQLLYIERSHAAKRLRTSAQGSEQRCGTGSKDGGTLWLAAALAAYTARLRPPQVPHVATAQ